MSEDTDWIDEYTHRGAAARGELKRALLAYVAEERRRREAAAAKRHRAEEQDRREWIDGIRRRLGLVAEVHECDVWQIGERWWAWKCLRPGCWDADWQRTSNSEPTRAAVVAKASAHRRRFMLLPARARTGRGTGSDGLRTVSGEWFRIESGEFEGRWHLAGWMGQARRTMPTIPGEESTWLAWENCPRCGAMVFGGDSRHPESSLLGTRIWAHEDWHAKTDYPHPADESAESRKR